MEWCSPDVARAARTRQTSSRAVLILSARADTRSMIPSSHAHPLSPPVETASSSSPFFPSSPSPNSDLFDTPTSQTDALFPASPTADEDIGRRGSAATLTARSSSAQGVGLGLRDSSVSRRSEKSATLSRASSSPPRPVAAASSPNLDRVPRYLAFPSAPHRLSPSALDSLPLSHLVALVQALSQRLDEAQTVLREEREELRALEKLAKDKGAGDGEIERVRVRARTGAKESGTLAEGQEEGEWRIELSNGQREGAEHAQEDAPLKTEVSPWNLHLCEKSTLTSVSSGRPRPRGLDGSHLVERLRPRPDASCIRRNAV